MILSRTYPCLVLTNRQKCKIVRRIVKTNAEVPDQKQNKTESFINRLSKQPVTTVLESIVEPDTGYEMALFPNVRKIKTVEVPEDKMTEERRRALRELAAKELKNIDVPEQNRRKIFGTVLLALVFAIDTYLVINKAGFWPRFATTPLFTFGAAYLASGQVGICNVAQKGMWQVDGTGLRTIEDKEVVKKLKQKVNNFNASALIVTLTLSLTFSLYPLS
eukprot:g4880.t1